MMDANDQVKSDSGYLIAHIGHTLKSHEHVTWWKPNSRGYTICIDKAGRYTAEEAQGICRDGVCIAVPVHSTYPMARGTPHYRQSNGTLAGLYDGGPHRVVENKAKVWHRLMSDRLLCSKTVQRPTPMPSSKARAIYLDPASPSDGQAS